MVAFGSVRERFGKTAGVAKLSDVFQFQWTSSDSLKDKWLRWLKVMRQMSARETLTIAGLEKAKKRSLEQHMFACSTHLGSVQVWISTCERRWSRALLSPRQWKSVLSCQRVHAVVKLDMKSRSVDFAIQSAAIAARLDISRRCAGNARRQLACQVSRAAVARAVVKAAQAAATPTSAIVVDSSVIEDLIVLVEMRTAAVVVNEDI